MNVYLKDEEEEEVAIGETLELLEKVQRQEGEEVVFGGVDGVILQRRGGHSDTGSVRRPSLSSSVLTAYW